MKNKGFTLIELLAVIVILAIIALIAVPIILNIIEDSRNESNERSIELYGTAVKNAAARYQLNNNNIDLTGTYEPTDATGKTIRNTVNGVELTVEYDGSQVSCETIEIYEDGDISLADCKVSGKSVDNTYGDTEEEIEKVCTYVDSEDDTGDQIGTIDLSDIVTCGTESFYVMKNENQKITMLSKYQLNVGYYADAESPSGIQNMNGGYQYFLGYDGSYWWNSTEKYPAYIYNEKSQVYQYVSEYERILKEEIKIKSARATLISYEQLLDLNCSESESSCSNAPSWVYSTSYWTGSASDSIHVWGVSSNGKISSNYVGSEGIPSRIRPVVTISVDELN